MKRRLRERSPSSILGIQLWTEGTALYHCVASYADRCGGGHLGFGRSGSGEVKIRYVVTIEVDMKRRAVVQARGWGNRAPSGKPLRLLEDRTVRERLPVGHLSRHLH